MKSASPTLRFFAIALAIAGIGLQPLHVLAACCCTLEVAQAQTCSQHKTKAKSCCAAKAGDDAGSRHHVVKCSDAGATRGESCACCVKRPHDATVVHLHSIDVSPEFQFAVAAVPADAFSPAMFHRVEIPPVLHSGPNDHQALLCVWRN